MRAGGSWHTRENARRTFASTLMYTRLTRLTKSTKLKYQREYPQNICINVDVHQVDQVDQVHQVNQVDIPERMPTEHLHQLWCPPRTCQCLGDLPTNSTKSNQNPPAQNVCRKGVIFKRWILERRQFWHGVLAQTTQKCKMAIKGIATLTIAFITKNCHIWVSSSPA